jgi:Family of unknown function (DUF6062)
LDEQIEATMLGEPSNEPGTGEEDLVCGQVLAACRKGECPVCFRLAEAARKRLRALLAEHATDLETRKHLRYSRGFCSTHTWLLPTVPHANLGVALIYHDLLRDVLDLLEERARRPPRGVSKQLDRASSKRRALPEDTCPLCQEGEGVTASTLGVIVAHFADPGFLEVFARSAALCLPHLLRLADLAGSHPNLGRVFAWHVARWNELDADLIEFTRKFDYRYAGEPMDRERDSWLRVLQVFAGKPERWPSPYTSAGEPRDGD